MPDGSLRGLRLCLAPIYEAHNKGIKVHAWVDETRPRNQGARLTAWELGQHGVPHTIIADNVGGLSCSGCRPRYNRQ